MYLDALGLIDVLPERRMIGRFGYCEFFSKFYLD
jgi:hypothetical protein